MERQIEASELAAGAPSMVRPAIASLQPKGTCWYCDQMVDNVRRFCSPSCRTDYLEEEAGYFSLSVKPAHPGPT
jgi:hypothetical protein